MGKILDVTLILYIYTTNIIDFVIY
jgi:hypothetical protein